MPEFSTRTLLRVENSCSSSKIPLSGLVTDLLEQRKSKKPRRETNKSKQEKRLKKVFPPQRDVAKNAVQKIENYFKNTEETEAETSEIENRESDFNNNSDVKSDSEVNSDSDSNRREEEIVLAQRNKNIDLWKRRKQQKSKLVKNKSKHQKRLKKVYAITTQTSVAKNAVQKIKVYLRKTEQTVAETSEIENRDSDVNSDSDAKRNSASNNDSDAKRDSDVNCDSDLNNDCNFNRDPHVNSGTNIFDQETECDNNSQSESDGNSGTSDRNPITLWEKTGFTIFDLDTECDSDSNRREEKIVRAAKIRKFATPTMHEARCNNIEKSSLRLKMKPYKKRLIHHQQHQEKNNGDDDSESEPEHNNSSARVISEKEEKHHKSGWRKPSRKQFRHQDIPVFKPDSVATSFLLKSKDIQTSIKKPDNKEITKSIVMKLGGQLKPDTVTHARPVVPFTNHTQTEASNPPTTAGMHHLPAIVPETPPVRRKSHDDTAQTKPFLKNTRQSTADMPQLNSDNHSDATAVRKLVKNRRKTIAGPEFLDPDLEQNANQSNHPQAPTEAFNQQRQQQQQEPPPRRRYSVTLSDVPMDLTNVNKPLQEGNHQRKTNIGNGATNISGIHHNQTLPGAVPFQLNIEGYNNKNVYYPPGNDYHSIAPTPYYAAPQIIATTAITEYNNGLHNPLQNNNNRLHNPSQNSNNNNTQQPNFQYQNFFNATPEQFFPDEPILKPSIKSLSSHLKSKFNIEILWSIANLYQKISKLVAKDRVTYKSKQNAQKCLNEAYGYVAQKLPELNLSPSLVREALLNPNFFSLPLNEHMKSKLYPQNHFRPATDSTQIYRTPTEEVRNPFAYQKAQEHHIPRIRPDTYPGEAYLQQNNFNPTPINQENVDFSKFQHTNGLRYDQNLLNKNIIPTRNHLNHALSLEMDTNSTMTIPKNNMVPQDPRIIPNTQMSSNVNTVPQFQPPNNHNVSQFQAQNCLNQHVKNYFAPTNEIPILHKQPVPDEIQQMYRARDLQHNIFSNKDNVHLLKRKNQLTLDLKSSNHPDMNLFKNHSPFAHERLHQKVPIPKIAESRSFLRVPEGLQITPCDNEVPPQVEATVSSTSSTVLPERVLSNPDVIVRDNSMQITKESLQETPNEISGGVEEKINMEFRNVKEAQRIQRNKLQEDSEFKEILTELLHKYQSKISTDKLKTLLLDQYWEMKKEDPGETIEIEDSDGDDRPSSTHQSASNTLKRKSFGDPQKHLEKLMNTALREEKPPTPPKKKLHSPDLNENYEQHSSNHSCSPSVRQELTVKRVTPSSPQVLSTTNKAIYSPAIEPISPVSTEKTFTFPEQPIQQRIYTPPARTSVVPIEVLKGCTSQKDSYRDNRKNSDSDQSTTSPYGPRPLSAGKKKPPNGKLCYVRESNTFIRYFDDNQVELFMRNLNIHNESVIRDGDRRKLSAPSVTSPIGRSEQVIKIPKNVVFSNKEDISDPEEYVLETELVKKNAPEDFASFYLFVTGYQIVRNNAPISFQTFLTMYNTNRLQELLDKYMGSEHRS